MERKKISAAGNSRAAFIGRSPLSLLLCAALAPAAGCARGALPPETGSTEDTSDTAEAPSANVTEEETTAAADETTAPSDDGTYSLDGRRVIFIGNSMIYFGGVVSKGGYRGRDTGWFYRICRENGDDTEVIDCTYGGHHLYDYTEAGCRTKGCDVGIGGDLLSGLDLSSFDVVFISESGDNNANFVRDVENVMKRFPRPDTKFVYMCHTYSYSSGHTKVTGKLGELRDMGVIIADWGHVCFDIYKGLAKIPDSVIKYEKNTFVNKTSSDGHHPNPLAGYVATLTCYCAVTGKSAVGMDPLSLRKVSFGAGVPFDSYAAKYYTAGSSNFAEVFDSPADIAGIQKLVDKYVARWK